MRRGSKGPRRFLFYQTITHWVLTDYYPLGYSLSHQPHPAAREQTQMASLFLLGMLSGCVAMAGILIGTEKVMS